MKELTISTIHKNGIDHKGVFLLISIRLIKKPNTIAKIHNTKIMITDDITWAGGILKKSLQKLNTIKQSPSYP